MAREGYVLIQSEVGRSGEVTKAICAIEGVVFAEALIGPYDVIAMVRADGIEKLGTETIRAIGAVPHVTRTITCLTDGPENCKRLCFCG